MIDALRLTAYKRTAEGLAAKLRQSLKKCERELARWDAHEREPEKVPAPMLRREVLEATRDMLLDELRKDSGEPKPS